MLWVVEQRNLWGDYGSVLVSGYVSRIAIGEPLLLHRTGPFLPPIFFPWFNLGGHPIVVSDALRQKLEAKPVTGISFRSTLKHCIVKLPWHEWNLAADNPKKYPSGGEPENYILGKQHDEFTATQMEPSWECLPPVLPLEITRIADPDGGYFDKFLAPSIVPDHSGFFTHRSDEWGRLIVDKANREWLGEHVGEWVKFCEVECD
jgi:hypothetical protein